MKKKATVQTKKNPEVLPNFCRAKFFQSLTFFLIALLAPQAAALQINSQNCSGSGETWGGHTPQLVLIIDDLGHHLSRGEDALNLPGKLNFAFIPYTPYAKRLANTAAQQHKEILLHAPMSTLADISLGQGGLTPELSQNEFRSTLNAALDEFPRAAGINNHMGSELTQQQLQMSWVMQELSTRDLYFVDSRTSENTVAASVATQFNVPNLSRHVFLDNDKDEEAIHARFQQVIQHAKRKGLGVAIGHPYPETIAYLRGALPLLQQHDIRLAFVSEILNQRESEQRRLHEESIGMEEDGNALLPPGCNSHSDREERAKKSGREMQAQQATIVVAKTDP